MDNYTTFNERLILWAVQVTAMKTFLFTFLFLQHLNVLDQQTYLKIDNNLSKSKKQFFSWFYSQRGKSYPNKSGVC